MTYYKCLLPGRVTSYREVHWPVEAKQWTPVVEMPHLCEQGWHLATEQGLAKYLIAGELWIAEGKGRVVRDALKVAFSSVKLVEKVADISRDDLVKLARMYADHVEHLKVGGTAAAYAAAYGADAAANAAARARAAAAYATDAAAYAAAAAAANAADAAYATDAAAYAANAAAAYAAAAAANAADAAYDAGQTAERQWQHDAIIAYFKNKDNP